MVGPLKDASAKPTQVQLFPDDGLTKCPEVETCHSLTFSVSMTSYFVSSQSLIADIINVDIFVPAVHRMKPKARK